MKTDELGRFGEETAAHFLKEQGYRIIQRNFRCRLGEVDLIACNRDYIVFVEVKLRKSNRFGYAMEYVTAAKQRRIIKAASCWLVSNRTSLQPRFDVIEVYAPEGTGGRVSVNHIEDAFQ